MTKRFRQIRRDVRRFLKVIFEGETLARLARFQAYRMNDLEVTVSFFQGPDVNNISAFARIPYPGDPTKELDVYVPDARYGNTRKLVYHRHPEINMVIIYGSGLRRKPGSYLTAI